jgi:hypothetical protein
MYIDGSIVFENNSGAINVSKNLYVCEDCYLENKGYVIIGDIENYNAFSVADSVYNSGFIFSDNYGFYISGDFINQGTFTNNSGSVNIVNDFLNEDAMLVDGGSFQIGQVST